MKNLNIKSIMPFVGVTMFLMAILFLQKEIREYSIADILKHIKNMEGKGIIFAFIFTVLNHWALTLYDYLGFRYVKNSLEYKKISLTSFVSFVFGNNIGFSGFSSSAVRVRFYSFWKIPLGDILQIIVFCLISFWVGLIATVALFFTVFSNETGDMMFMAKFHTKTIGSFCLTLTIFYLLMAYFWKGSITLRGKEIKLPNFKISILQILVSIVDWIFAGAALYVLLPSVEGLSFVKFFSVFILGLISGLVSNIPGGLGVFETILAAGLSSYYGLDVLLGTIFIYRLIFYIFPLIVATIAYSFFELMNIKDLVKETGKFLGEISGNMIPSFLFISFFTGGLIIFSDGFYGEVLKLGIDIPQHYLNLAIFLERIAGLIMIVLSFGLRRKLYNAYRFSLLIVPFILVISSLHGISILKTLFLLLIFITLITSRNSFYLKPVWSKKYYFELWFGIFWISLISTVWIEVFSRASKYSKRAIDWEVNSGYGIVLLLQIILLIALFGLLYSLAKITASHRHPFILPSQEDLDLVKSIVAQNKNPYGNLALLGDKSFYFNEERDTFIMYRITGRYWISYGDPIGVKERFKETIEGYFEYSHKHGGKPVFYQVARENTGYYADIGFNLMKIGEEAAIVLSDFTMEGKKRARLRYVKNKFDKRGFTFEILHSGQLEEIMPELREVSDRWLENKNVGEKRFSLGCFDEKYLKNFSIAVVKEGEKIIAFGNIFKTENKCSLALDLMRYIPGSEDHVMEYLFINLILWAKEEGYRFYDLGMAPLSGIYSNKYSSIWYRAGHMIFTSGEKIYNFRGLKTYKEQFGPQWEAKYIALKKQGELPFALLNISFLIGGGVKGVIKKNYEGIKEEEKSKQKEEE